MENNPATVPSRKHVYEDLNRFIFVPDRPDAVRKAKSYAAKVTFVRYCAVALMLALMALAVMYIIDVWLMLFLCIVVFSIEYAWMRSLGKSSTKILDDQCDAQGAVPYYTQLTKSMRRRERSCAIETSNVGAAVHALGRVDDMVTVSRIIQRYFPGSFGTYLSSALDIEADIMRKDWTAFRYHYDAFVQASRGIKQQYNFRMNQVLQYPALVELYKQGNYPELYDAISNYITSKRSNITEVRRNYYLCKVALLMGNAQLAEKHRNFVMAFGGTTYYKAELANTVIGNPTPQQPTT